MFAARGIRAVVGAEHHANLLGPLGCGFLSLDIWVAADDADDAAALLCDLRESQQRGDAGPHGEDIDASDSSGWRGAPGADAYDRSDEEAAWRELFDDTSARDDATADDASARDRPDDDAEQDSSDDEAAQVPARIERRRRTSLVLLLGCCVTFGTGHLAAGAPPRGIALAAIELVGLLQLWAGNAIGLGIVVAAVVADLVGALWIIHRPDQTLPPARIHRS
jgi:hypothetical protein